MHLTGIHLVFWIVLILVLGLATIVEGYPLGIFGFQRNEKSLRAKLIEWIIAVLAAVLVAAVIITFSEVIRSWNTGEPALTMEITRILPAWIMIRQNWMSV